MRVRLLLPDEPYEAMQLRLHLADQPNLLLQPRNRKSPSVTRRAGGTLAREGGVDFCPATGAKEDFILHPSSFCPRLTLPGVPEKTKLDVADHAKAPADDRRSLRAPVFRPLGKELPVGLEHRLHKMHFSF